MTFASLARLLRPALALAALLSFLTLPQPGHAAPKAGGGDAGAVYVLSNAPDGNAVLAWKRAADGTLTPAGSYPTGGLGTGGGLGSQGALILSENGRWLFAVDAGSNEISSFRVRPDGLRLVERVPSGGTMPTSLTLHDDLLFVLNAGGTGNIAGFEVDDGELEAIPEASRPLSGDATAPGQIAFSPDGETLVVTERATNRIATYAVDDDGEVSGPTVFPSSGATPFGFAFGRRGVLVVSEANGAPGGSAASSYRLDDGELRLVTGSAPTLQGAACWVVITRNGRYAYTSNAASGSISAFSVGKGGELTLLNADGRAAATDAGPTDMALSRNSQFLYVRNGRAGTIGAYAVASDGSLTPIAGASGLPAGTAGIAAR